MEQHQAPSGTDSDEDLAHHYMSEPDHISPQRATPAVLGQSQHPRMSKAPAPPIPESASKGGEEPDEEESGSSDVYFKYRREALKLSRTWRKKLHRAANAFAAGDHSGQL